MGSLLSALLVQGGPYPIRGVNVSTGYSTVPNIKDQYNNPVTLNGAVGDGIAQDGPAMAYWFAQAGGGICRLPAGVFRTRQTFSIPSGTTLIGDGHGSTTILIDDTAGNIGDLFTLNSAKNVRILGMKVDAVSARSAGCAVKVVGGDPSQQLAAFGIAGGGHVIDVDMNNQFTGVQFDDDGAGRGDWGTVIGSMDRKAKWLNWGAGGGKGVFINSLHAASQVINNIFLYTATGGSTAGIGVHYRGSADITLNSIQTIGGLNGFVCDAVANPSAAGDALIQMVNCQWDSTSTIGTDNMQFNLGAGVGGSFVQCDMVNNWIAGAARHGLYITGDAAAKLFVNYIGGTIFQNGLASGLGYGIRVDNGSGPGGTGRLIVGTPVRINGNQTGATLYT